MRKVDSYKEITVTILQTPKPVFFRDTLWCIRICSNYISQFVLIPCCSKYIMYFVLIPWQIFKVWQRWQHFRSTSFVRNARKKNPLRFWGQCTNSLIWKQVSPYFALFKSQEIKLPWLESRCCRRRWLGCWHSWPQSRATKFQFLLTGLAG